MHESLSPHIEIRNLNKSFKNRQILNEINLDLYKGELTAIIGRSGCGKSTLLRCLDGLEAFDSGSIKLGTHFFERKEGAKNQEMPASLRKKFGLVFQGFNLFPHLTILENLIKAPMVVKKMKRQDAEAVALPFLEKVGLISHIDYYPVQLSGGQQQRAAIARALTMAPSVMMYDEPTSALDPWLSEEVFRVMRQLAAEEMTQIVVTHEVHIVREMADRVVFIEDGEIVETGTPEELFDSPKHPKTRQFLKRGERR